MSCHLTVLNYNGFLIILLREPDHIIDHIMARIKLNYDHVTVFNENGQMSGLFAPNF